MGAAAAGREDAGFEHQKNGEFSFWIANANTASWNQVGGISSAAGIGEEFSGTHMFVKPGGSEPFWGLVDTFQIQSFTVVSDPFANWMSTNTYTASTGGMVTWHPAQTAVVPAGRMPPP